MKQFPFNSKNVVVDNTIQSLNDSPCIQEKLQRAEELFSNQHVLIRIEPTTDNAHVSSESHKEEFQY